MMLQPKDRTVKYMTLFHLRFVLAPLASTVIPTNAIDIKYTGFMSVIFTVYTVCSSRRA